VHHHAKPNSDRQVHEIFISLLFKIWQELTGRRGKIGSIN